MRIEDFDYELPRELIAQTPAQQRDKCRLMVLDKEHKTVEHRHFYDILNYVNQGDCLVLNDSRVIPARMYGTKESTGAHIEMLLIKRIEGDRWECMVRPGKRLHDGDTVLFEGRTGTVLRAEILGYHDPENGTRLVEFSYNGIFMEVLEDIGSMPLPPYITRPAEDSDKEMYQTVYSRIDGSVAAPTAGLHFTPEVLSGIKEVGIALGNVCLHVGAGTFLPVKSSEISGHPMHREPFSVSLELLKRIRDNEGSLIAVGTTSVRTLESLYYVGVSCIEKGAPEEVGQWVPYEREYPYSAKEAIDAIVNYLETNGLEELKIGTRIIIVPGFRFRLVDVLVTNFHQSESTLILLVSAFVNGDWRRIYDYAIAHDFRFLSYGDSSLLFRPDSIAKSDEIA